jgi:Leucine-rich repeat (LRR) protein
MTTEIETYLNSLSEDILTLNISGKCKGIKSLPDLTRFKNLKTLKCSDNKLTSLPTLPQNLEYLYCSNNQLILLPTLPQYIEDLDCSGNKLTLLPTLPQNLQKLSCRNNQLTLLPTLPQNLEYLYCSHNKLTSLHTLPQNLQKLYCSSNKLTSLPTLPQNLEELSCSNNPIYEIVNNDSLITIKRNIQTLNNFRHLYYCLKFKKQLRKLLWEKVREPNAKTLYSPMYLIENLGQDDDLDTVLNNWCLKCKKV